MWYCDIVLWEWKSASGPHRLPSARLGDDGELLWGHDAPARDDQGQEAQGKQREKGFNYLTILQFMFFSQEAKIRAMALEQKQRKEIYESQPHQGWRKKPDTASVLNITITITFPCLMKVTRARVWGQRSERERKRVRHICNKKIFAKPLRRFIWNQKLVLHMY